MATEEEKGLTRLLAGCKDSERREMCIAGIQMFILGEDDIKYMIDSHNDITSVRAYYRGLIEERL